MIDADTYSANLNRILYSRRVTFSRVREFLGKVLNYFRGGVHLLIIALQCKQQKVKHTVGARDTKSYLASSANANIPAASGAEADVPV